MLYRFVGPFGGRAFGIFGREKETGHCIYLIVIMLYAVTGVTAEPVKLVEESGIKGGLVVHVGCGDGKLTAGLRVNDSYLVHGLDTDAKNVAKAREHIHSKGLYGPVSVDVFDGKGLPYVDNLVNLIVADALSGVTMKEVMRVLAPRGVAYVNGKKTVKPVPKEIDDWSHFLHDASGNAVAHDRVVAAPKHLQWIGGPLWCRSHEYFSSLCAMVSSGGRVFCIFDEGPTGIIDKRIPDKWTLVARDAFNGVILWKRRIPLWGWKAWKQAAMEKADWRTMGSQRNKFPLGPPRRLVAVGPSTGSGHGDRVYVTLGYHAPVTELDAATGKTLRTFEGTERTDEIICQGDTMVLLVRPKGQPAKPKKPSGPVRVLAINLETGKQLWESKTPAIVAMSLATDGQNVLFHSGDSIVCIDAASGKRRWQTPAGGVSLSVGNTDATLIIHKDVVLCASRKQLVALSIKDGRILWKLPGARGFGVGNPPDLFVADNLVWYGRGQADPQSITGYDPLTGKPGRTVNMGPVITHGHHPRCYRSKATDNYLFLPKMGAELIDIKGDKHSRHNWLRGACRYGMLPCNGLLYSTPHPCFCFAGVKMNGFIATAPAAPTRNAQAESQSPRLTKGPAYGKVNPQSAIRNPQSSDWPMYRHDPKRSGSTSATVGFKLSKTWSTKLGGRLTQPVVADGRLFVVRIDAGQVVCLNADTGQVIWNYTAGGCVDSAPSWYKGYLIFGSADGWVHALRASDGELAWRFRAAARDRRVVAFGRVESAWPVHGSVLILDGTVYLTSGRSSFLDGGITLYGLDYATGKKLYETTMDGPHPDLKVRDENAYAMEGSKSDILVTDGELIYLFHNAVNKRLEKQPTPIKGKLTASNRGERDFGRHLFSNAGFLDTTAFNRNYWIHTDRWPAFNFAQQSPKAGQLVVFDDTHTYAVKYFVRRNKLSPQSFPATDGYYLFADSIDNRPVAVKSDGKGGPEFIRWLPQTGGLQTAKSLGVGFARAKPVKWVNAIPVRVRVLVRTSRVLFATGTPDVCDPDDPTGALEGRKDAVLMAFDPDDGKKLTQTDLTSPAVFDGMIAADSHLYVSTTNGGIVCYGGKKE